MVLQRVGIEGMAAFGFYDSVRHSKLKLVHTKSKVQKTILSSEDIKSRSRSGKIRRQKKVDVSLFLRKLKSKNNLGPQGQNCASFEPLSLNCVPIGSKDPLMYHKYLWLTFIIDNYKLCNHLVRILIENIKSLWIKSGLEKNNIFPHWMLLKPKDVEILGQNWLRSFA